MLEFGPPSKTYLTSMNFFKQMTLDGDKLSCYEDMESKILAIEMSMNLSNSDHSSEALLAHRNCDYRDH